MAYSLALWGQASEYQPSITSIKLLSLRLTYTSKEISQTSFYETLNLRVFAPSRETDRSGVPHKPGLWPMQLIEER